MQDMPWSHRWGVSELHNREYPQRTILRRSDDSASRVLSEIACGQFSADRENAADPDDSAEMCRAIATIAMIELEASRKKYAASPRTELCLK